MSSVVLTDEEKEQRFHEQWARVTAGLDRAVAWIKANKENMRCGFSMYINKQHGIEINIGYSFDDDGKTTAMIQKLFSGKKVQRTRNDDNDECFVLSDDDLQLTFKWSIWHSRREKKSETDEVVI